MATDELDLKEFNDILNEATHLGIVMVPPAFKNLPKVEKDIYIIKQELLKYEVDDLMKLFPGFENVKYHIGTKPVNLSYENWVKFKYYQNADQLIKSRPASWFYQFEIKKVEDKNLSSYGIVLNNFKEENIDNDAWPEWYSVKWNKIDFYPGK